MPGVDVLERAAAPAQDTALAARTRAAVSLPRDEDRAGEPELRGLARALRALVRRARLQRATRALAPARAEPRAARGPAALRRAPGHERAQAHPLLRPDELAAGQTA